MNNFDFNTYDNILDMVGYNGFIDRLGNFYRVCKIKSGNINDSHNEWAIEYLKKVHNVNDLKFSPTNSALIELINLSGPAELLVNCFGFVYYSHDFIFHKPVIRLPNPKVANYKATEEQLNILFFLMRFSGEITDIPIFNEEDVYSYEGQNDYSYVKRIEKKFSK